MDRQKALKQIRLMQAWHEDNGDGPNADYDAMYGDRYCHYNGKAEIVPNNQYCGYAERRTDE